MRAASRIAITFSPWNREYPANTVTKTRIVTDGSAHFPDSEAARRHKISVVPYSIRIGERVLSDGLGSLSPEQYLEQVASGNGHAQVLAPSVEDFSAHFQKVGRSSTQIVCVCASRYLSLAWQHAEEAAALVRGKLEIMVLDSLTTSTGLGLLAEAAAVAVTSGASAEEAARVLRMRIPNVYAIFFLETMKYLQSSSRVDTSQATLAAMLGIKPIIALESGELIPFEKVRTRTQALERLIEFTSEFPHIEQLAVLRGRARVASAARQLRSRVADAYPDARITNAIFGPALAALIGPDGLGIILCEASD